MASGGVCVHSRGREAVLFHGALQQGHRPVLQVGSLLYDLSIEHQVRCSCGRQTRVRQDTPSEGTPEKGALISHGLLKLA